MRTPLEQAVLDEHAQWVRRLELERWTRYTTDPDQALRDLIARELAPNPATANRYRPTGRTS